MSGVRVILIGAYNIDDLYHIGRIDTLDITLIIIVYFLVVICTVFIVLPYFLLYDFRAVYNNNIIIYNVYASCMMLSVVSVVSCAA